MSPHRLLSEATPEGEQTLIPSVAPITPRVRLAALAAAPMSPRVAQKPPNIGLFDEDARNQLSLF